MLGQYTSSVPIFQKKRMKLSDDEEEEEFPFWMERPTEQIPPPASMEEATVLTQRHMHPQKSKGTQFSKFQGKNVQKKAVEISEQPKQQPYKHKEPHNIHFKQSTQSFQDDKKHITNTSSIPRQQKKRYQDDTNGSNSDSDESYHEKPIHKRKQKKKHLFTSQIGITTREEQRERQQQAQRLKQMAQHYELMHEEKEDEELNFWEYRSGKNSSNNNARVNDQRQQQKYQSTRLWSFPGEEEEAVQAWWKRITQIYYKCIDVNSFLSILRYRFKDDKETIEQKNEDQRKAIQQISERNNQPSSLYYQVVVNDYFHDECVNMKLNTYFTTLFTCGCLSDHNNHTRNSQINQLNIVNHKRLCKNFECWGYLAVYVLLEREQGGRGESSDKMHEGYVIQSKGWQNRIMSDERNQREGKILEVYAGNNRKNLKELRHRVERFVMIKQDAGDNDIHSEFRNDGVKYSGQQQIDGFLGNCIGYQQEAVRDEFEPNVSKKRKLDLKVDREQAWKLGQLYLKKLIVLDKKSLISALKQNELFLEKKQSKNDDEDSAKKQDQHGQTNMEDEINNHSQLKQQIAQSKQRSNSNLCEIDQGIKVFYKMLWRLKVDEKINDLKTRYHRYGDQDQELQRIHMISDIYMDRLKWIKIRNFLITAFGDRKPYDPKYYFEYDGVLKQGIYFSRENVLQERHEYNQLLKEDRIIRKQEIIMQCLMPHVTDMALLQRIKEENEKFNATHFAQKRNNYAEKYISSIEDGNYDRPGNSPGYGIKKEVTALGDVSQQHNGIDAGNGLQKDEIVTSQNSKKKLLETDCSICWNMLNEDNNPVVYCSQCEASFHQHCYGIPVIPESKFLCEKCEVANSYLIDEGKETDAQGQDGEDFNRNTRKNDNKTINCINEVVQCRLCSETELPVIELNQGYYHPTCLFLFNLAIYRDKKISLRENNNMEAQLILQGNLTCSVCFKRKGLTVQCSQMCQKSDSMQKQLSKTKRCLCFVHPLCAFLTGMEVWLESTEEDTGQYAEIATSEDGNIFNSEACYPKVNLLFKCKKHADKVLRNYEEQSYYRRFQVNYKQTCEFQSFKEFKEYQVQRKKEEREALNALERKHFCKKLFKTLKGRRQFYNMHPEMRRFLEIGQNNQVVLEKQKKPNNQGDALGDQEDDFGCLFALNDGINQSNEDSQGEREQQLVKNADCLEKGLKEIKQNQQQKQHSNNLVNYKEEFTENSSGTEIDVDKKEANAKFKQQKGSQSSDTSNISNNLRIGKSLQPLGLEQRIRKAKDIPHNMKRYHRNQHRTSRSQKQAMINEQNESLEIETIHRHHSKRKKFICESDREDQDNQQQNRPF